MFSIFSPNDGYTEKGFIREAKGLHPALRFTFRPFTQEQRMRLVTENRKLSDEKAAQNTAKVVAAKVVDWDLVDGDSPIKPNWEVLTRFKPAIYERFVGVIMGLDASDDDPEATKEEKAGSLADQLAADASKSIGDARAESDQKN